MEEKKRKPRISYDQKCKLMYLYLCTDEKIIVLSKMFHISTNTVHRIIRSMHHPIRKPRSGNFTNHPRTKRKNDSQSEGGDT